MTGVLRFFLLVVFSGFFLFAGISKLLDPAAFSHAIAGYRLVGPLFSWLFALWIPWLEVLCAIALWTATLRRPAAFLLGGLLLVFEVALLSAAFRGLDISCGCLGSSLDTGIVFAVVRNLVLLALLPFLPGLKGGPR